MKMVKQEDRRGFFRITDAIGVSYEVFNKDEDNREPDEKTHDQVDVPELLQRHNDAINHSLAELTVLNPQAAKAVAAINKKVDTLIDIFELNDLSVQQNIKRIEDASISASGIAFVADEDFEKETLLQLTLYLKSSQEQVYATGQVVECQPIESGQHMLRIKFTDLNDADREKLIQYIVQRQSILLKNLREQMDDD
ncbi:MAG: PilZ domain-containing protein [Pseudomonadota bacterium]